MLRIKKDDLVMVMSGKDKGKSGKILKIFPPIEKAIVEGLNMVKKARRRTKQDQQGGLIDIEAPIHLSNLMLFDKQTNKPVRVKFSILKDGTKVRLSKKTGAVI